MKAFPVMSVLLFLVLGCAEVGEGPIDVFRPDQGDSIDQGELIPDFLLDDGTPPPDGTEEGTEPPSDGTDPAETADPPVEDVAPDPDVDADLPVEDVHVDDVPVEDTPTDPGPGTCTPSDFPYQAMCSTGNKCTLGDSTSCTPAALCDLPGPQGENQICTGSGDSDNCQRQFVCLGDGVEDRCRKFCGVDADCTGANSGCLIEISTPSCPDGLTGVKVCTHNCDYFYQTGCQTGQACRVLMPLYATRVYSDCTAAGSGTQGSLCPNGSIDCAAGYDCFEVTEGTIVTNECLKLCNYSGGYPTCDYGYTCSRGTDWPTPIGACL